MQLETSRRQIQKEQFSKFQSLLPPKNSCDFVILPELWLQGAFEYSTFSNKTTSKVNSFLNQISVEAKKNNYWIHSGTFLVKSQNQIFNQAYIFDNNGTIRATYKKNYIFGFGDGESKIVSMGTKIEIIETPWGKISFAICYDIRFPELFRKMISQGADILMVSSAWPALRINEWKDLVAARAIENQCLVIACNGVGLQTDAELGGCSLVVAANGNRILELGTTEEVKLCTIDHNFTRHHREVFPVLKDIKY